jgi:phage terminase large subunit-like protein
MGKSMKRIISEMPEHERNALLDSLDIETLGQMAREEWWYVSRPEQNPPPGDWTVHLYLAGRGCGKSRSGAEWLVQRAIDFPYDSSGFPTERLVVAYNLSDTRIVCIEGASVDIR